MARPIKKGLDYFPLDADIFSDKKMKVLYSRFGADGFTLYTYLLCEVYKEGFYMNVDEDFYDLVSSDLNMSVDKIGQIMNFLLERSLFDGKLFRSDKVLTSVGIQRRYQLAVSSRAAKRPITVNSEFWLLSDDESQSFIHLCPNSDLSEKNGSYSENNADKSRNNDTKKKKGNKSKRKKSKVCGIAGIPCTDGILYVDDELYGELTHTYSNIDVKKCLDKIRHYLTANPDKQRTAGATIGYIKMWISQDREVLGSKSEPIGYQATYSIEEFESTSVIDDM